MRRRLRARSCLRLLREQPLGEVDTLAQIADLAARLLDLSQEIFTQHLQVLPHASIDVLGADALCEGTHEREQQYGRPDDGQREEKGHSLGRHTLPHWWEPLGFPLFR